MAVVQMDGLTPDNAERVIAYTWHALVKKGIASPQIDTRRDGQNRIAIRLTFETNRDADAVSAALQELWSVVA
jgi:hypothetical protein